MSIQVTKSFLPPWEEYIERIKPLWESHWLTNNGSMVLELEEKLRAFLGINELLFTNNGTIVLQMALKALGLTGAEVITTPFSYVATTNTLLWEGCTPVFVDVRSDDFNLDAEKVEACITPNTKAILATHVFGNPCDVDRLQAIATKHQLALIYDAAHAFGVTFKGKSLLSYGDISTCSFHATKVFHTIEGGMINTNANASLFNQLKLYRSFGHIGDDYYSVGINAKSSEFHAAMGLAVLPYFQENVAKRKKVSQGYDARLKSHPKLQFPTSRFDFEYNYAYYPIVFESEAVALKVKQRLADHQIMCRRYFYPSLNTLPFVTKKMDCPISEQIAAAILSLPLSVYTTEHEVEQICNLLLNEI